MGPSSPRPGPTPPIAVARAERAVAKSAPVSETMPTETT